MLLTVAFFSVVWKLFYDTNAPLLSRQVVSWLTLYWFRRLRDYACLHACQNGCSAWSEWLMWRLLGKQKDCARKCWKLILMILYWNFMILLCYFLYLKVMIIKGKAAVSRFINLHKNVHLILCTSTMLKNRSKRIS